MAFVQENFESPFDDATAVRLQTEPSYHLSPMSSPSHHHHSHNQQNHQQKNSSTKKNRLVDYQIHHHHDDDIELFNAMSPSTPNSPTHPTTTTSKYNSPTSHSSRRTSHLHEQVAQIHLQNMAALEEIKLDTDHHNFSDKTKLSPSPNKRKSNFISPTKQQQSSSRPSYGLGGKNFSDFPQNVSENLSSLSPSRRTFSFFDIEGSILRQRPFEIFRRIFPFVSGVLAFSALIICIPALAYLTPYRDGVIQMKNSATMVGDFLYPSFTFFPMYLLLPTLLFIFMLLCPLSWHMSSNALKHEVAVKYWNDGGEISVKKWRHTRTNAFPLAKLIPLFLVHVYVVCMFVYCVVCVQSSIDSMRKFDKSASLVQFCASGASGNQKKVCHSIHHGFRLMIACSIIALLALVPVTIVNLGSTSLTAHRKKPRAFRYNSDGTPMSEEEAMAQVAEEEVDDYHFHAGDSEDLHTVDEEHSQQQQQQHHARPTEEMVEMRDGR